MALSTLRPAASPRLSVIKLDFTSFTGVLVETIIADMGSDLRRIADEVARIEREFDGAVNFAVLRDSGFGAAFNSLNARCRFFWEKPRGNIYSPSFIPCRSFRITLVYMAQRRRNDRSKNAGGRDNPPISSLAHLDANFDLSSTCTCRRCCAIRGKLHPMYPEAGPRASILKLQEDSLGRFRRTYGLAQQGLSRRLTRIWDTFQDITVILRSQVLAGC